MADEALSEPADDSLRHDSEAHRNERFNRAMATTQRPVVTPLLIAINISVFIVMAARGFYVLFPNAESFLPWGADFGPLVTHGQWWRIVTAAFLPAGLIPLLMNMIILWRIGAFTERLFGRMAFTVLYLFAGIGGNLASLAWLPFTVAVGPLGAIFGLYGGLLAILVLRRNAVPLSPVASIAKSTAIPIAITLLSAIFIESHNADIAVPIGGFVTGFLLGCALIGPLVPADLDWRQPRSLLVALTAAALVVAFALRMPMVDDWRSDLNRLIALDTDDHRIYNDALRKTQRHQISAAEFAKLIDQQILPRWNAERENFSKLKLSQQERALADQLLQYMSLRSEAWSLMETAISTNDPAVARSSFQKQAAAEAALQTINREIAQRH